MAYSEIVANRIRERLMDLSSIQEKEMMGGLVFMYNEKMCVGVIKDELMCRIDPELVADAIEQRGCRQMDFTGRPMKSYIIIDESGMRTAKEFEYWISLALDFNSRAKSSKRKK